MAPTDVATAKISTSEISAPKIFVSAGEASGEHYGALLIEALRELHPGAGFFGLGGQRMEALGCRLIVNAEDVAVMGITEVILHMPRLYAEYRRLKQSVREERPDVAVLIDFPDINLRLAAELHRLGIPVIFFVSPQLWAWKKRRIRRVQRFVDRMLVIFPFEEAFYRQHGVDATYVGHPLADLPLPSISRDEFASEYSLDASKPWVGLLPGSREKEIRLNLPEMVRSASLLGPGYEYLLPLAPTLTSAHIAGVREIIAATHPGEKHEGARITLVLDARAVLHHARASIVASGTATVEAALIGNPFIVVYRVSALTYAVAKRVVKVPFVAMVNLIAGRCIVPELIQDDFNAAGVVSHMRILLSDDGHHETRNEELNQPPDQAPRRGARETMKDELGRVAELLRAGHAQPAKSAIARVASITSGLLVESVAGQRATRQNVAKTAAR